MCDLCNTELYYGNQDASDAFSSSKKVRAFSNTKSKTETTVRGRPVFRSDGTSDNNEAVANSGN